MATFHPYPSRLLDLKGEQDVLTAVNRLDFQAHVFVRLGLLDERTNRDREIDFLVLHPELGIVLIEVKGGKLLHQDGQWQREFRGKVEPLKESPGAQLNAQQYLLFNHLKEQGGFVPQITRVLALPHMTWPANLDLETDLPACRILDRTRLEDLLVNLRRAVAGSEDWEAFKRSDRAPNHRVHPARMLELVAALQPSVLPPPTLAELLKEEGELQDREAAGLLNHLSDNFARGRYHLRGAPGSGKSLIARQVTRLWATEGRKVLYLAYNKALIFATQTALVDLADQGKVHVSTYHDLAYNLLDDLGRLPSIDDLQQFFAVDLPGAFEAALPDIQKRWDALVVDEAQDLDPAWVTQVAQLLRDPDQDPLLLVEDPAQSLFRQGHHALGQPWTLDLNLRQHPALRRAAWEAYPGCGWPAPPAADQAGVVEFRKTGPGGWEKDLAALLDELVSEGLEPGQVMILAPRRPVSLGLKDGQDLGPWRLNTQKDWWEGDPDKRTQVRFGTVQGFKGLEADVVVYLAPAYRHDMAERWRYVALSRARHRAFVLEKAIPKAEGEKPAPQPKAPAPAARPPAVIKALSPERQGDLMGAIKASRRGPLAK